METCDDDFVAAASDFVKRNHAAHRSSAGSTRPTCTSDAHETGKCRQAGRWQSEYHDTLHRSRQNVGQLLTVDELGIGDDTIVMYSTDNGPHMNTWPDGG
jgi:arylsulfatase